MDEQARRTTNKRLDSAYERALVLQHLAYSQRENLNSRSTLVSQIADCIERCTNAQTRKTWKCNCRYNQVVN